MGQLNNETMELVPTIGLEIHVQLKTRTKMFCPDKNDPNETRPNVNVCPICLGHPGTLPVPNIDAMAMVLKVGLALGAKFPEFSKFDRKHYFYPDLPKGYQISQYDQPLCEGGTLTLADGRSVRIRRIHLEEDTGRLQHDDAAGVSLVDFNRAGVPLMELVTEPDITSGEEASAFAQELRLLFRMLDVSDADMEKGQLRVEANISLRQNAKGHAYRQAGKSQKLGTKVEIKNLNSFKAVRDAVAFEIKRQSQLLAGGKKVVQETRGWDPVKGITESQREKEEASDYRYFTEPDIPPFIIPETKEEARGGLLPNLAELKAAIPELPWQKRERLIKEFGLTEKTAEILVQDAQLGGFFDKAVKGLPKVDQAVVKKVADMLAGQASQILNESGRPLKDFKLTPAALAGFSEIVVSGAISSTNAQKLFSFLMTEGGGPQALMAKHGLAQVSDANVITQAIEKVIAENSKPVSDYQAGKAEALQFLVGKVMAATKGRANPQVARAELEKILSPKS